jgi:hypothetical protein
VLGVHYLGPHAPHGVSHPSVFPECSIDLVDRYGTLQRAVPPHHRHLLFVLNHPHHAARPGSLLSRLPQGHSVQVRQLSGGISYHSQSSNNTREGKLFCM